MYLVSALILAICVVKKREEHFKGEITKTNTVYVCAQPSSLVALSYYKNILFPFLPSFLHVCVCEREREKTRRFSFVFACLTHKSK